MKLQNEFFEWVAYLVGRYDTETNADMFRRKIADLESCLAEAEREVERMKSLMQQVRREIHEQGHVSSGSWASMLHVEGLLNSEGRVGK